MKKLFFLAITLTLCFNVFTQTHQAIKETEKTELTESPKLPTTPETVTKSSQITEPAQVQPIVEELTGLAKAWKWVKDNLLLVTGLLLGLGELIAKAFPTEKNQARFEWLLNFVDVLTGIFGNNKTGGGQHTPA